MEKKPMIAFRMSKECNNTTDIDKIKEMKAYSVGQLLYLLREIETCPYNFSEIIIKECYSLLYDNNIICI